MQLNSRLARLEQKEIGCSVIIIEDIIGEKGLRRQ